MDSNVGAVNARVEFSMGWVDTGLKGANNKNRPNKCGSKGKQKLRPISVPGMKQNKEANKEATGSREGTWKRGVTQNPCTAHLWMLRLA